MQITPADVAALRNGIFTPKRRAASPMECLHAYARGIDDLLRKLFSARITSQGGGDEICLVAVGGYGRGEMFPHSDVDIMVLYSERADRSLIKAFERDAWDLGLAMGFVARTVGECSRILGDDCATDTALLEATHITGSTGLFTRLIDLAVRPWFRRRRRWFIDEMRKALIEGVYSTADTLYRIEPDVKNGICCLRDCQRISWAERVAGESFGGQSRPFYQFMSREEQEQLTEAYAFLARVRTELHMLGGRRLDILEVALQHDIAGGFGYPQNSPAELMSDFFRAVTTVKQCILTFTEHVYEDLGWVGKLRSALASFSAGNGLQVIDGVLHLRRGDDRYRHNGAWWAMEVFTTTATCRAEISTMLRNRLREIARQLQPKDFRTGEIESAMCSLLSLRGRSGRIIQLMYETGILELLLPEFAPLACRVEFDTYHEFTVDQHTLLALCAFDDLVKDSDDLVQRVYLRIENRRVFRLALLLHDVGKALEGDHCRSGAILAGNAAERLGFSKKEQRQVEFLVYHHLDLSELSLRREFEEESLRQFAETVGSPELLDMLYLLTVLDIRHVGSRTWTGWKAAQLAELFTLVERFLHERQSGGNESGQTADYQQETMPEDRRKHQSWLETLRSGEMQLHSEAFTGFYRVTVVTHDRISLLSDIAACFIHAGLDIISAQVNTFPQNKIVDMFDVEPDGVTRLSFEERVERFHSAWKRIATEKTSAAAIVEQRLKSYPPKPVRHTLKKPKITVNNSASPSATLIEINTPDRFGLFYTLVTALSSTSNNISGARISTAVDEAVDIFYVTGDDGNKVEDTQQLTVIEKVIVEALSGG
jgi:[protein-PII] uridylyltransferase